MTIIVNNGISDPEEPVAQAPVSQETNVFDAPLENTQGEPDNASDANSNIFNNIEEATDNDHVPLKVFQETKAKAKHKLTQSQQEAEKFRQERDYYAQQLQQTGSQQPLQPQTQQAYTPEQISAYIEQEASRKAVDQKIRDLVLPAAEKYTDFMDVTEDLPWSAGLILATKDLGNDAGDFIYMMSKKAPDKIREIANAATAEERGALLAEYKNAWKNRKKANSPDKKVISHIDSPPSKTVAGSPGSGRSSSSSYQDFLNRTGKLARK